MKRVIIALAVLVLTMPAVAQDTGGLGAGAIKCSQITAEAALSRDAQERFIRNYCLQHPNEDYQNAVWALLNSLPIMAHTP